MIEAALDHASPGSIHAPSYEGVAPPGWEPAIKKMKKGGVKNPWAIAWWLRKKGTNPPSDAEARNPEFDAACQECNRIAMSQGIPEMFVKAASGDYGAQANMMNPGSYRIYQEPVR